MFLAACGARVREKATYWRMHEGCFKLVLEFNADGVVEERPHVAVVSRLPNPKQLPRAARGDEAKLRTG